MKDRVLAILVFLIAFLLLGLSTYGGFWATESLLQYLGSQFGPSAMHAVQMLALFAGINITIFVVGVRSDRAPTQFTGITVRGE